MYVRAADTDLKSAASPGSSSIAKLAIGTKVEVLEKKGMWAQVKTGKKGEQTGFVFGPKLSRDKPDKERFGNGTVATASEGDTAQALRGLTPTAEKFAGRTEISKEDVAAVERMETRIIPATELAGFLKDGRLGEFSQ